MFSPTDHQLEAAKTEAAAAIAEQLRQAETEFGLQVAVAVAQGITEALTEWSEDATGTSLQEALQHPLNRRDPG